jgi:hypothetical protein
MGHHGAVRAAAAGAVVVVLLLCSVIGAGLLAIGQVAAVCQQTDPAVSPAAPTGSASGPTPSDGAWSLFLAAVREQETGSPEGDYAENVAGCQGAYCWEDTDVWRSMAARAGVDVSAYPDAFDAPPALQDAVATGYLYPIYLAAGGGEAGYTAAAASWNGGTTAVRANPALGPGATNYTYASEVVEKMSALAGGSGEQASPAPSKASTGDRGAGDSICEEP